MAKVPAYVHGAGAVQQQAYYGGTPVAGMAVNGAVPAVGLGGWDPEPAPQHVGCQGITKAGGPCGAPPANGTDYCVGHQRQLAAREKADA